MGPKELSVGLPYYEKATPQDAHDLIPSLFPIALFHSSAAQRDSDDFQCSSGLRIGLPWSIHVLRMPKHKDTTFASWIFPPPLAFPLGHP